MQLGTQAVMLTTNGCVYVCQIYSAHVTDIQGEDKLNKNGRLHVCQIYRETGKQGLGRVCFAAHVANTESRQHTCSKTMVTGPVRSQSWHPPVALYVELPVAQPLALRWHPPGGPPSIPMHPPGEEHVLELGTLHECGPHIP